MTIDLNKKKAVLCSISLTNITDGNNNIDAASSNDDDKNNHDHENYNHYHNGDKWWWQRQQCNNKINILDLTKTRISISIDKIS